jgi:hypothetical protein
MFFGLGNVCWLDNEHVWLRNDFWVRCRVLIVHLNANSRLWQQVCNSYIAVTNTLLSFTHGHVSSSPVKDDWVYTSCIGGLTWEIRSIWDKPGPVPLAAPQIPYRLSWYWTRAVRTVTFAGMIRKPITVQTTGKLARTLQFASHLATKHGTTRHCSGSGINDAYVLAE